jgi:hypothetical protein
MFRLCVCGLVPISGRSPGVGERRGDRGPDMLIGVALLELEAIEEFHSCFTSVWQSRIG